MIKYYLHLNNEQKGPFSAEQLQEMWKVGEINVHTQFWTKANDEWRRLETIIRMFDSPRSTGPTPPAGPPAAAPGIAEISPVAAATAAKVAAMVPRDAQDWRDRMAGLAAQELDSAPKGSRPLQKSFPVLSFLSTFTRYVGWAFVLFGLLYEILYQGVAVPAGENHSVNWLLIYSGLITTLIGLGCIICGEMVGVAFSIEENTFKTARNLDDIAKALDRIASQKK